MKSLKPIVITAMISSLVMATAGFPLGIIPAILVLLVALAYFAFRHVVTSVTFLRQQKTLRPMSPKRDIWQENAQRMREPRRPKRIPMYENVWLLVLGAMSSCVVACAICACDTGINPNVQTVTFITTVTVFAGLFALRPPPKYD